MTSSNDSFVIGLDISTSCIGVAILNPSGDPVELTYYNPEGKTLVEKTVGFKKFICSFLSENNVKSINSIFVEENLQKFRRGFSSAQVINKLARFNGMVSYVMFEEFNIQPVYINVNEGRKCLGLKIPRGSNTKEEVLKFCQQLYPEINWPTKKLRSGPRRGLVILDPCCYDISDALITAKAGLKLNGNA